MGILPGAFGPVSAVDRRLVVRIPEGWSFTQAASTSIAFLTAHYGLVDLAGLRPGQSVVIHAAAGGVGMAAVQLARHLGAEVFGTASPGKWSTLEWLGLDGAHIASSRTLAFRERFLEQTNGRGVDVVLDCLAREFVDASLELLPRGGRFLEMGKTDIRDADEVAQRHAGVSYTAFDLIEAGPERIQQMLLDIVELFRAGVLEPLPITTWDVRRAPEAFRFVSQARHVGKIVLTVSAAVDTAGTVLITGGTGGLGGLVARHMVAEHGVRSVLLASRQGEEAEGASALRGELESLGARVEVAACDVADRGELERLLGMVPQDHPLTAVVHAAGALDDGVIESLTPERVDRVLAPKLDAAWHLHELTAHMDLSAFVLFSSAAGTFGAAGQGGYAAANAFLDALATYRRAQGLPCVSMAWGQWAQSSRMAEHLTAVDQARLARAGLVALSSEQGLELFDAAREVDEAVVVPVRLDRAVLRAQAKAGMTPALLRDLIRAPSRREVNGASGSLTQRLAGVPEEERERVMLEMVCAEVATVLGRDSPESVDERRAFKEFGVDSLAAVELRNRLSGVTGLQLPSTVVFNYSTPIALARHLLSEVAQNGVAAKVSLDVELDRLESILASIASDDARRAGIATRLQDLLSGFGDAQRPEGAVAVADRIHSATADEVFDFIDKQLKP